MRCKPQSYLGAFALAVFALNACFLSVASAQSVTLFSEDFEGLDLGPNVDEGLNDADPQEEVYSPDGPVGWTVDRSGVPGYGTEMDGVTEFAGWNFLDPIWWSATAGDQERSHFATLTSGGFVIAVADGDEWDDAPHEPGTMNTFLSTPPIPVASLPSSTSLSLFSSWRPEGQQTATITASFDGGDPQEILRWESNAYLDEDETIPNPNFKGPEIENEIMDFWAEEAIVPLQIPTGSQEVVLTFGYTEAGNNWWWAIDDISLGDYYEDFEGVELGPNIDEGIPQPVDDVWTNQPPTGWSIDNMVPGQDEENDFNGVTEWIGWSFPDKDWWVGVAGDQRRSEYSLGEGTVMVADPDEWDDADHPDSSSEDWYNTYISTPEISLEGADANSVTLKFDSSWRPEYDDNYQQTGNISVSYDGGAEIEVLLWESDDQSEFYKDDNSTNETITVDLENPEGAQSMVVTFGLFDAGNDWWWAIDNIEITGTGDVGIPGDYDGSGELDAADLDLQAQQMESPNPDVATYDLNDDGEVNFEDRKVWVEDPTMKNSWIGDANLDLQFNSGDMVQVFSRGKYETGNAAGWEDGDWNGDTVFGSGDMVAAFVGGGYEKGPKAVAASAVPEPTTWALALLAGLACWSGRRRRI